MRAQLLALVVMSLLFTSVSRAQEVENGRLTVYGNARVSSKADRARINFEIRGVGKALDAAFADATTRLDAIVQKLHAFGLSDSNLSTSFFRNEENFGDKAFLSSSKDYRALMTVTITTDSLALLERITSVLSQHEIERVMDVRFELHDPSRLRLEAVRKATMAAMDKAEAVCTQLGVRCGKILAFDEMLPPGTQSPGPGPSDYEPFSLRVGFAVQEQAFSRIFPADVDVDSDVKIIFAIE